MVVNSARCDYLTLTSFSKHDELMASFADLYPRELGKETKIQGYTGTMWDGVFLGSGRQRKRAHFMLRASGEVSDVILYRTADIDVKCTRLDLQITIWIPNKYDARKLYDTLASIDTPWDGRRLTPHIIQSGDGLDTVYIGSRTSDRFCRVYVKPNAKGEASYLRFEMEFKGIIAQKVRDALTKGIANPKSILRAELNRLPFMASRALRAFDSVLGDKAHKVSVETVFGQNKTLDWLEKQVEPAIYRMLHSHEHMVRMRQILDRWTDYAKPPF